MERLDTFMARANTLYYATHDPFADFTTSPEVTQVFGELLGAWAAVVWQAIGRPAPVILAELGPGRGTLTSDALRTVRAVAPDFAAALSLHLVETSPRLRALQAAKLEAAGADIAWHDCLETLPRLPLILLANEFLDALPIRQYVRRADGWAERWVADGRIVERAADGPLAGLRGTELEGGVVERCEPAERMVAAVAHRIVADGGAALFLDYGAAGGSGADTLQALRGGRPADPFVDPGEADLTAHVDFAALAGAARRAGAWVHGPIPQGILLSRLGLFQRTDRLARTLPPARAGEMISAAQRLAEPTQMGRLFKAMALTTAAGAVPPGFEA